MYGYRRSESEKQRAGVGNCHAFVALSAILSKKEKKKKVERKVKAEQKAPNPCFNAYNTLFSSVHVEMKFVRGEIMTPGLLHVMISRHAHQATKQETNKIKNRERERERFNFSFFLFL